MRLYYFALVVFAVVAWIVRGIQPEPDRPGAACALRDNEANVMAFGVNPTRAKLAAFAVSGWVAAIAGVLFVYHQAAFRDVSYYAYESVNVFVSTVIGGLGGWRVDPSARCSPRVPSGCCRPLVVPGGRCRRDPGADLLPGGLGGLFWNLRDHYLRSAARRHGWCRWRSTAPRTAPSPRPRRSTSTRSWGPADTSDPSHRSPVDDAADRRSRHDLETSGR